MKAVSDFEKAVAQGEFSRMLDILERAATEGRRCRVKALMHRIHKMIGIWLGEYE